MKVRESRYDRIFMIINYSIITLLVAACVYPFIFVVSNSISDPMYVVSESVYLFPKGFSLDSYRLLMDNKQIWPAYLNTIIYTVAGTLLNLFTTMLFSYPLSRKDFSGKGFFMVFITITMFFGGGLIPLFLIVKQLGIYDTRWAILLPSAISTWNVIITRSFLLEQPLSLQESAMIDGCNDYGLLLRIVLPLSTPIISVVGLYSAVLFWNSYFLPMVFTPSAQLQTLQLFLMKIVVQNSQEGLGGSQGYQRVLSGAQLKFSIIIVSILPIVCVYPFLQRYFIKGVMIGALKG